MCPGRYKAMDEGQEKGIVEEETGIKSDGLEEKSSNGLLQVRGRVSGNGGRTG